uniref:Uncharacterized protein n=1 Tax=Daphnia galeata TaxID=27404 RepID=A0A8J2WCA3_9CRUS|nr:unnamed protein product [Daphnia galeata]
MSTANYCNVGPLIGYQAEHGKDLRPYQQHSGVSQVRQRLKTQCCLHYNEELWNQVNQKQIL